MATPNIKTARKRESGCVGRGWEGYSNEFSEQAAHLCYIEHLVYILNKFLTTLYYKGYIKKGSKCTTKND